MNAFFSKYGNKFGKVLLVATVASAGWLGFGPGSASANPVTRTGPNGNVVSVEREPTGNGSVNTTVTGPQGRQTEFETKFEDGRLIREGSNGQQTVVEREGDGNTVNTTRTGPNGNQTQYSTTRDGRGNATRTYENGSQVEINRTVEDGKLSTTRTGPNGKSRTWTSEVKDGRVIHTGPGGRSWTVDR